MWLLNIKRGTLEAPTPPFMLSQVAHNEAQLQKHTAAAAAAADEVQAAQAALEELQQQLAAARKQDKAAAQQVRLHPFQAGVVRCHGAAAPLRWLPVA